VIAGVSQVQFGSVMRPQVADTDGAPVDHAGPIAQATEVTISAIGKKLSAIASEGGFSAGQQEQQEAEGQKAANDERKSDFLPEFKRLLKIGEKTDGLTERKSRQAASSEDALPVVGVQLDDLIVRMRRFLAHVKEISKHGELAQRQEKQKPINWVRAHTQIKRS